MELDRLRLLLSLSLSLSREPLASQSGNLSTQDHKRNLLFLWPTKSRSYYDTMMMMKTVSCQCEFRGLFLRVARRGFSSYTTTGASFIIHIRSPSSSSPRPSLHKKKEKKPPQRRRSPAASSLEWINSSFLVPLATGIEIRSSSEKSHPSVGYVNIFSSGEYTPINPSIHPSSQPFFFSPSLS